MRQYAFKELKCAFTTAPVSKKTIGDIFYAYSITNNVIDKNINEINDVVIVHLKTLEQYAKIWIMQHCAALLHDKNQCFQTDHFMRNSD